VLFSGVTPTACGTGQSAMGPFYCPGDQKVYIDLAFFRDLKERFKAPGEFAQAYVIAHEVGHHVQNLLGIADKVHEARQRVGKAEANALSVRMELQADCLAGVWGKRTDTMKQVLEPGDLEAALTAASAIGDDRLQQQAQGRIVPESFTHGSSEQRVRWFRRGFETGDMNQCNTFKAERCKPALSRRPPPEKSRPAGAAGRWKGCLSRPARRLPALAGAQCAARPGAQLCRPTGRRQPSTCHLARPTSGPGKAALFLGRVVRHLQNHAGSVSHQPRTGR
jgi:hypothetical protein